MLTAIDAERAKRWAFKALAAAGVFTVVGLVRYAQTWQHGYWAWQRDVYTAIEPVDRALPAGARVGCFNAGIPGYFSRRQIINLDGLVNNAVVPYWQARRFEQYLSDAHIGFIYDEKLSMARARQFSQGLAGTRRDLPASADQLHRRHPIPLDAETVRRSAAKVAAQRRRAGPLRPKYAEIEFADRAVVLAVAGA